MPLDEAQILDRAAAGDASGVGELLESYQPRLHRTIVTRMDPRRRGRIHPEDVLQESLIDSDYSPWFRSRFDAIAINTRGAREVAFDSETVVTERELARVLKVRQTPTVIG